MNLSCGGCQYYMKDNIDPYYSGVCIFRDCRTNVFSLCVHWKEIKLKGEEHE